MPNPNLSHNCGICLGVMIAWWLIASGLLVLTWNHVIAELTKAKSAKYWQALLLIATLGVLFCAPRYYFKRYGGGCSTCCHEKGGCPLSKPESR